MSEKQGERAELQKELERYRECDPEVIDAMKEEIKVAKEAANRWTGKISKQRKYVFRLLGEGVALFRGN